MGRAAAPADLNSRRNGCAATASVVVNGSIPCPCPPSSSQHPRSSRPIPAPKPRSAAAVAECPRRPRPRCSRPCWRRQARGREDPCSKAMAWPGRTSALVCMRSSPRGREDSVTYIAVAECISTRCAGPIRKGDAVLFGPLLRFPDHQGGCSRSGLLGADVNSCSGGSE